MLPSVLRALPPGCCLLLLLSLTMLSVVVDGAPLGGNGEPKSVAMKLTELRELIRNKKYVTQVRIPSLMEDDYLMNYFWSYPGSISCS